MTPNNDLHTLIHRLSGPEKRYFRLFSNVHSKKGGKHLEQLFNAIEKQTEYDEAKLKLTIGNKQIVKQFAVLKHQLYQQILESLRQFDTPHAPPARVATDHLSHAQLLLNRGLTVQAIKLIRKSIKMAVKYELPEIELYAYQLLRNAAYTDTNIDQLDQLLTEVVPREKELSVITREKQELVAAKLQVFIKQRRQFIADSTDGEFMNILPQKPEGVSTGNMVLYHEIHSIHSRIVGKNNSFLNHLQQAKEALIEAGFHRMFPMQYLSVQYNLIQAYLIADMEKAYQLTYELEDEIDTLPKSKKPRAFLNRAYRAIYLSRLAYYFMSLKPFKAIEQIQGPSGTFFSKLSADDSSVHDMEAIRAYFMTGKYRKCIRHCNRTIHDTTPEFRYDIKAVSYLTIIFCQYDLRGPGHLSHAIKHAREYIEDTNRLNPYEETILEFFEKVDKMTVNVPRRAFQECHDKLTTITESDQDPLHTDKYVRFRNWFYSKFKGVDILKSYMDNLTLYV